MGKESKAGSIKDESRNSCKKEDKAEKPRFMFNIADGGFTGKWQPRLVPPGKRGRGPYTASSYYPDSL